MAMHNVRRSLVRFWRNERGDGAIGSIISMSVFILLLVVFVWMILTYYSFRVLSTAANEGAAIGAYYDEGLKGPDVDRGENHAKQLIEDTGSVALVEGEKVEANLVSDPIGGNGDRVEVEVSGQAITPFFSMNLKATGSAPVEEFRPQGDEI